MKYLFLLGYFIKGVKFLGNSGFIVRIVGVVVDVLFSNGNLPSINNALVVQLDEDEKLVLEVQEHLDSNTVRTIAMSSTAGLKRGINVIDSGAPSKYPLDEKL